MGRPKKIDAKRAIDTDASDDFAELLKVAENDYAEVVDEWVDVVDWIDTGSYSLNALLSGSIYKGFPGNKITALAGEPATGKTFYAVNAVAAFQKQYPEGFVFYFESESAISKQMLIDRGVDPKRVAIMPVMTVQEFRTQVVRILDKYLATPVNKRKKILFVLDSLGNLSTKKEVEDIAEGKDTRDMTRAQLIRGAFRVITLKLGIANCAMIITNHTYDVVGSYVPLKKMGGGSGLEYAASTIIFLSKKKDSEGTGEDRVTTGAIIKAVLKKARLTIENKKVDTLLRYDTGLDPYYGLIDIGIKAGILQNVAKKITFPDGNADSESRIEKNPEKWFTKDVLDKLDKACENEFMYGKTSFADIEEKEE